MGSQNLVVIVKHLLLFYDYYKGFVSLHNAHVEGSLVEYGVLDKEAGTVPEGVDGGYNRDGSNYGSSALFCPSYCDFVMCSIYIYNCSNFVILPKGVWTE